MEFRYHLYCTWSCDLGMRLTSAGRQTSWLWTELRRLTLLLGRSGESLRFPDLGPDSGRLAAWRCRPHPQLSGPARLLREKGRHEEGTPSSRASKRHQQSVGEERVGGAESPVCGGSGLAPGSPGVGWKCFLPTTVCSDCPETTGNMSSHQVIEVVG